MDILRVLSNAGDVAVGGYDAQFSRFTMAVRWPEHHVAGYALELAG